ncbi:hypothetical protein EKG38_14035 [Shewanella canadensis]|uniref:Uncharacterized protein n=1 Tax=Shewanella canadensis TaxID=271096 RepID=A0A431WTY7_9GAMM|nr:hypothetical protein [Shewanella canadensis]RTR38619.1 hypothetical protein EKG38_14035 [Shewanella canadensis]
MRKTAIALTAVITLSTCSSAALASSLSQCHIYGVNIMVIDSDRAIVGDGWDEMALCKVTSRADSRTTIECAGDSARHLQAPILRDKEPLLRVEMVIEQYQKGGFSEHHLTVVKYTAAGLYSADSKGCE